MRERHVGSPSEGQKTMGPFSSGRGMYGFLQKQEGWSLGCGVSLAPGRDLHNHLDRHAWHRRPGIHDQGRTLALFARFRSVGCSTLHQRTAEPDFVVQNRFLNGIGLVESHNVSVIYREQGALWVVKS